MGWKIAVCPYERSTYIFSVSIFRLWISWHHISVVVRLVCLVELVWAKQCLSWSWSTTLPRLMVCILQICLYHYLIYFAPAIQSSEVLLHSLNNILYFYSCQTTRSLICISVIFHMQAVDLEIHLSYSLSWQGVYAHWEQCLLE